MWRLKQFMPKEPTGLEGRTVDIGNIKVHVRNAIAEGGFSCVYLACDAIHPSRQYALKYMICNDDESLGLSKKEISVMKLLKGHPNIVMLHASTIFDMGRTKEVLLLMDFCDKSLVTLLENRGAGYFEEKQVLLIFRDVCNAIFSMHCQSPPIAHRDLKAENVLLGVDGAWKLCDFGSTSTNHKCFDRPEEMGIEEDIIRKHTTPAYRAPEMWDLFRKEIISEKVDIWALGCLLYRICYFKSAFDGESKLQILNGNYRIPELPKYSSSVTALIKDMLQASPDARPDITQVWFRVNLQLPEDLQKQMPDASSSMQLPDMHPASINVHNGGIPKRTTLMPRRSPPPPPSTSSREQVRNISPQTKDVTQHSKPSQVSSKTDGSGGPLGAFWTSQHAQDSEPQDKGTLFDEDPRSKHNQQSLQGRNSPPGEQHVRLGQPVRRSYGNIKKLDDSPSEDFEIRFDKDNGCEEIKTSQPDNRSTSQNEAFNTFVAEFDTSKLQISNNTYGSTPREGLEAEVERQKKLLRQANLEKAEITSKYEKLSAICRSQRQEIQELKHALAAVTPAQQNKDGSKEHSSPGSWQSSSTPPREKIEGSVWELQQGMIQQTSASPSPDSRSWQAFAEEPKPQPTPRATHHSKSVRTINGHLKSKQPNPNPATDVWGFEQDGFVAFPLNPQISSAPDQGNTSQRRGGVGGEIKVEKTQPAGWAGF